jgi:ABC-type branched-subunit amino acid transport system permease subunit
VQLRLAWGERLGVLFTGISLGSILLLVALGLAITYGLMGVINMAHGELMMIGAYATYVVQNLFAAYLPGCLRLVHRGGRPGVLPRRGAGGRGAGAQRDPLALRPAAGNAAGHLGHQPDPDAGRAHACSARRTWRWRTRPGCRAACRCCPT